jgi:hypothetical protein
MTMTDKELGKLCDRHIVSCGELPRQGVLCRRLLFQNVYAVR